MTVARRIRVHGRVQGVGFRYFVSQCAAEANATGWVRNRSDGTVEALVWVPDGAVEAFLDAVRTGPRWGRVHRLDVRTDPSEGDAPASFSIRSDR